MKIILCIGIVIALNSSSIVALEMLTTKYSWPTEKPAVDPDPETQCMNYNEIKALLQNHPTATLIVELGSWLGASARFMLDHAPHATLIAIDHWKGSIEHQTHERTKHKLLHLYETFLVNCWDYKERLIPLRTTTLQGLHEIAAAGLTPDVIYIDASHDYDAAFADIAMSYALFPSAILAGDDWLCPEVQKAVKTFADLRSLRVVATRNFWYFTK